MEMDEVTCSKCGQPAQYKCERCLEPYCSSQCQIYDWQDHKSKCYKFPNLIPINMLKAVSNLHLERFGGNLRRHSGSMHSGNDTRRTNASANNGNKTKPKTFLGDNDFNMVPKVSSNTSIVASPKPICGKPATWRVAFSPSEGFFDAMVQFKEEMENEKRIVWVTDLKYDSSLRKLLAEINRSVSQKSPCDIDAIYEGALVAAPLDRVLYRAEVLESCADNQKATVRLIDYGNELRVSFSQLFPPIPIMSNLNAYAFRVCLPNDYGPVDIESVITIKIIGEKGVDNYYNVECKSKSISLHLPVELLNKEHKLKLVKCFPDGRNALLRLCTSGGFDKDLDKLLNSPESLSFEFESVPKIGALVAARTQSGWKRSRLLGFYEKKHQFMVYAIDEGFISLSPQIKRIPDSFITQPIAVFAISTSSADCMLSEPMLSSAKRLNIQLSAESYSAGTKDYNSQMQCGLFDEDRQIVDAATASVFTGSISELGIKLWHDQINEADTVVISHVLTYKEIYIASQQTNEYRKILANEYLKCVRFGADEAIQKDDIVMFCNNKGDENQCCRGQVLKCEGSQYKIMDIDSGSEQYIANNILLKPTDFVCSLPVRCLRVVLMFLESIPTPVANNKALEALETCKQNAVEFDVTFSENKTADLLFRTKEKQSLCKKLLPMVFEPASNEVPIIYVPKSPVNTFLPLSPPITPIECQPYIAPPTAEIVDEAPIGYKMFTMEDLEIVPITCGEKIPLYVLDPSTILDNESPFMTAADYSNKESLIKMEQYLKVVPEYCKSDKAPKNGYAPRKSEICLSVFAEDGEWYRALCMDEKPNDIFIVMFLDYGNIAKVNKKDIMPIIPDLMFPSNANMVYIEGLTNKEEGLALIKATLTNPIIYANVRKLDDADAYVAKLCV